MTTNKGEVLIRTENLKKVFPGGLHALNGVSQEIRKGEVVVIVGPSGSGKSPSCVLAHRTHFECNEPLLRN